MSFERPVLSDVESRYPFAPRSRRFFESMTIEEGLLSKEVIAQTEGRLLNALGRSRYEPNMSGLIEFSSFFDAALVASQDPVLTSRFAKKEAERAKEFFVREQPEAKADAIKECFGTKVNVEGEIAGRMEYAVRFEEYLSLVSKYELSKEPRWKLVRQELAEGVVHITDNLLNDFFGTCAQAAIEEGVRNLRKAPFPKQLQGVKASVIQYVPAPKPRGGKGYAYVEDLLKHPVSDGRHRLVWLVLAPYLVNVKKVDNQEAIDKIRTFVAAGGETSAMKRFVEYNVRRAKRNGLLPPTFTTLKAEHPDIYGLLPKEVIATEAALRLKGTKETTR